MKQTAFHEGTEANTFLLFASEENVKADLIKNAFWLPVSLKQNKNIVDSGSPEFDMNLH